MTASLLADKLNTEAWIHAGFIALGLLAGLPIVLFILGRALGYLTLAIARRSGGRQQILLVLVGKLGRLIYRGVISVSVIYFYVCIPVLVFGLSTIIVGNISLIYLTPNNTTDTGVIKIVLLIGVSAVIAALVPVITATYLKARGGRIKVRYLTHEEAPLLWKVVEEVAQKVGTRPVDTIRIVSTPGMAVTERPGERKGFRRPSQRQLLLGLGALPGMSQGQFKSILAHEYGHFSNRDTAGGGRAFRMDTAFGETLTSLENEAFNTGFLPWTAVLVFIHLLLRLYFHYIFISVTFGAERLQEIMADRYAAQAYGGSNFANSLTYIVRQGLIFDLQFEEEEKAARKAQRKLDNLYTLPPLTPELEEKLSPLLEKAMNQPTTLYDTHPAPRERIRLVEQLDRADGMPLQQDTVWSLMLDPEGLQMEMTGIIQANLFHYGGHWWAKEALKPNR